MLCLRIKSKTLADIMSQCWSGTAGTIGACHPLLYIKYRKGSVLVDRFSVSNQTMSVRPHRNFGFNSLIFLFISVFVSLVKGDPFIFQVSD